MVDCIAVAGVPGSESGPAPPSGTSQAVGTGTNMPFARQATACLAFLLLALLPGCDQPPNPAAIAPRPAAQGGVPSDVPDEASYVIGAGDQLGISVYRAPELSVPTLSVRPDGRISMPLIPDILASGKTPTQLGKELAERLKEYVNDPIVTVMVSGFVGPFSRQVRVIGAATEPMAIPYRDHMTVLDVMIATKGLTKFAAGNRAIIVRTSGEKRETLKVRLNDLLKDGDIDQNVEMLPGDTLIIPESWF